MVFRLETIAACTAGIVVVGGHALSIVLYQQPVRRQASALAIQVDIVGGPKKFARNLGAGDPSLDGIEQLRFGRTWALLIRRLRRRS